MKIVNSLLIHCLTKIVGESYYLKHSLLIKRKRLKAFSCQQEQSSYKDHCYIKCHNIHSKILSSPATLLYVTVFFYKNMMEVKDNYYRYRLFIPQVRPLFPFSFFASFEKLHTPLSIFSHFYSFIRFLKVNFNKWQKS